MTHETFEKVIYEQFDPQSQGFRPNGAGVKPNGASKAAPGVGPNSPDWLKHLPSRPEVIAAALAVIPYVYVHEPSIGLPLTEAIRDGLLSREDAEQLWHGWRQKGSPADQAR